MAVYLKELELTGTAGSDIHDVTAELGRAVEASGVGQGLATVHTPGSTAAVTTIEYESGALGDLKRLLDELAPEDGSYAHNERWGDGNGYSHLRAALLGPSLSVPVVEGRIALGTWQQVIVLDFDNKPRRRKVLIQIIGDAR